MVTKFDEVYHLFLNSIQDYHIKNIFNDNIQVGEDLLETFLIRCIPKFYNCVKDIKDIDLYNKSFNCLLDIEELGIVCNLMILSWLDYTINDITQMGLTLTDNDFKHYSEEKNLEKKVAYSNNVREQVNQDMVNYGVGHTSFSDWAVGNYGI